MSGATENTAAASVEDMIAPTSSPVVSENPNTQAATEPAMSAVTATPMVASATPCPRTGRMSSQAVSRPPEKRMNASATTPSDCANW